MAFNAAACENCSMRVRRIKYWSAPSRSVIVIVLVIVIVIGILKDPFFVVFLTTLCVLCAFEWVSVSFSVVSVCANKNNKSQGKAQQQQHHHQQQQQRPCVCTSNSARVCECEKGSKTIVVIVVFVFLVSFFSPLWISFAQVVGFKVCCGCAWKCRRRQRRRRRRCIQQTATKRGPSLFYSPGCKIHKRVDKN